MSPALLLKIRNRAGFTLFEVVLVVGLVTFLFGAGVAVFQQVGATSELESARQALTSLYRRAHLLSLQGASDSSWGVHVEPGVFTLYQGASWATRTQSVDEPLSFASSVSPSDLMDVVFAKRTGIPNVSGTTTLSLQSGFKNHVVVNSMGVISYQTESGTPVVPLLTPEMNLLVGLTSIPDGGIHAEGSQPFGVQKSITFTIENQGGVNLALTGSPRVAVSSLVNISSVSVSAQPATPISPLGTTQFTVLYTPQGVGSFSFALSIDNTDSNEHPYNVVVSGTGYTLVLNPEIEVTNSGNTVPDGGTDAQGIQQRNEPAFITYEIVNSGSGVLTLSGVPRVVLSSPVRVSSVQVLSQPNSPVPVGGSSSVTITYTPTGANFSFQVSIANDDSDENPYNWTVSGTSFGGGGGPPVPP